MPIHTEAEAGEIIRAHLVSEFLFRRKGIELVDELDLIESGIVDSMGIFRLVNFLQERFDVMIEPTEIVLDNFQSLAAMRRFIAGKLAAAPERPA